MQHKPTVPHNPDAETQAVHPDLTLLLNAGMGVVYVDDDADFPHSSLLIVKKSAAPALVRMVTELIEVTCPFVLVTALLYWFT